MSVPCHPLFQASSPPVGAVPHGPHHAAASTPSHGGASLGHGQAHHQAHPQAHLQAHPLAHPHHVTPGVHHAHHVAKPHASLAAPQHGPLPADAAAACVKPPGQHLASVADLSALRAAFPGAVAAATGAAARGARRGGSDLAVGGVPGFASLGGAGMVKAAAVVASLAGAGTVAALNTVPSSPAPLAATPVLGDPAGRWPGPGFSSGPSMATYPVTVASNAGPTGKSAATPGTTGSAPSTPVAVAEPASLASFLVATLMLVAGTSLARKRRIARAS